MKPNFRSCHSLMRWVMTGSVSGSWSSVWAKDVVQRVPSRRRNSAFFFMEMLFLCRQRYEKPRFAGQSCKSWLRFLCDVVRLFLFHQGSDFLGFHGVDVAIGIAEAEGTVVTATHGEQTLHLEVETAHQFLGERGYFTLLGIHCYCCHIV